LVAELILAPELTGQAEDGGANIKAGAWRVAQALSAVGVRVREQVSVCSGAPDFQKAMVSALKRSDVIVTLGGLSTESDGIAKAAVSKGLGLPFETNKACLQAIEIYCKRTGIPFLPEDAALAQLPKGSLPIPGKHGKIPGILISSKSQHIVMLPGSERESLSILTDAVLPHIQGRAPVSEVSVTRTLRTYGMSEEDIRRQLSGLLGAANPTLSIQKEGNEVLVGVTGKGAGSEKAASVCTPTLRKAAQLLGDSAYGLDVESLQAAVVDKLKNKELGLAIAEAGSSGMLTRVLNETAGGSDVVRYSVFVDDNAAKHKQLGVSSRLLKKQGAVSEQAAVAVASAAREKSGAQVAISLLMGDGQDKKSPHGLAYIAVCGVDCVYVKKLVIGSGDPSERDLALDAALSRALNMIRLFVDYFPKWYMGAIPLEEALDGRTVTNLSSYDDPHADYKKKGPLARFFGNFIIRKADRPGVKVKKFVFITAMLVLAASSSYVGYQLWESYRAHQLAAELQEMFTYGDIDAGEEIPADFPRGLNTRFAALFARNEDVVAHIHIPGTNINYPIVQTADNDFYLRRNFNRESTSHGVPFMDKRVNMRQPSDNMVVYGHNMMDDQLFGDLLFYNALDPNHGGQQALDFFKDHHLIEFTSIFGDATTQFKIFSIFISNASDTHGPVFNYHNFIEAETERDFINFVDQLMIRSMINTGVDVQPGDQLLTLSTCTYEFDDARFVVVARRLRRNETPELNRGLVSLNENPLMPNVWYELFGGSPPEEVGQSAEIVTVATDSSSSAGLALLSFASMRVENIGQATEVIETAADLPAETALPPEPEPQQQAQTAPPPETAPAPQTAPPPESQQQPRTAPPPEPEPQPEPEPPPQPRMQESAPPPPPQQQEPPPANRTPTHSYDGTLRVRADGREITEDALYIVSRIVQIETGSNSFHDQAIMAQAVAAYSFVRYYNDRGLPANVLLAPQATPRITNLTARVLGEAVHFNGRIAFTPYHATSSGTTNSSRDVWGGHYPYLIPVDSSVCMEAPGFERTHTISYAEFSRLLERQLGITSHGDAYGWLEVLSRTDGGYIGNVSVLGHTTSLRTGARLTGRLLRENVFGLRSAAFEVEFDSSRNQVIFTTFGHGHGVGMPQNGANVLAQQGWSYIQILEHYFPGTQVF